MQIKLTKLERLLLSDQLRILEKLYPDEAGSFSKYRKALEEGFALEYESLFGNIDDELSVENCKEIIDILNMYSAIICSCQKLEDKSELELRPYLKFSGFDGNNEGIELAYTKYLIINSSKWEELKYDQEHPDFNSHMPMLGKYRRMLSEWKKCEDRFNLSKEKIKRILET